MFGFGIQAKTIHVLRDLFGYEIGGRLPKLSRLINEMKSAGFDEFDIATMFMITELEMLNASEKTDHCVADIVDKIEGLTIDRPSVRAMVNILKPQFLEKFKRTRNAENLVSFEKWLYRFKKRCGEINQELEVDENGQSIVDFFEMTVLKEACRNNESPEKMAEIFAPTFSITSFGQQK